MLPSVLPRIFRERSCFEDFIVGRKKIESTGFTLHLLKLIQNPCFVLLWMSCRICWDSVVLQTAMLKGQNTPAIILGEKERLSIYKPFHCLLDSPSGRDR